MQPSKSSYRVRPAYEEPAVSGASSQGPRYGAGDQLDTATRLWELAGMLWRGKWILLVVWSFVVGAAAVYVVTRASEYDATSLLMVRTEEAAVEFVQRLMEQAQGRPERRSLDTEMFILRQSEVLVERVADRLLAARTVPETGEPLTILYNDEGDLLSPGAVVARVRARVYIAPVSSEKVDGIRVIGTSTVAGEAAFIANLYAEEYIARADEMSRSRLSASRTFVEEQEAKLKSDLQSLEDQIKTYMSSHGATALDQETSHTVSQIAQLEVLLDDARLDLGVKEASLQAIEKEITEIEPKLVSRVASGAERGLEMTQEQIAELEVRREQYYQLNPQARQGGGDDAELAELNRRIEFLHETSQQLSRRYVDEVLALGGAEPGQGSGLSYVAERQRQMAELRIEIGGLRAKLDVLQRRLDDHRGKLKQLPQQALRLAQLQREQASTEQTYVLLTKKLQEMRIAQESNASYAEIIRPASVPRVPARPDRRKTIFMAMLFGLLLGGGLVLLRERVDTRVHHPEDLRVQGQTLLGVIPDMMSDIKKEFSGREKVSVEGRTLSTSLAMLLQPTSRTSEAYRQLLTNIQFSRPDRIVQCLLVTSPEPGEGKSTTAANLAVAMAQSDRRTVIVDADLRRPQVHDLFGVSREVGLSDLILDEVPFDPEAFAFGDLYVIPAGRNVSHPGELMSGLRIREFVDVLRGTFDVVIFDAPPLLAFNDAMLLSTQCDGTVLVAAADQTDRLALAQAVTMVQDVGGTLIGSVLNGFDAQSSYGYGYRYSYYNYHDHYGEGVPRGWKGKRLGRRKRLGMRRR